MANTKKFLDSAGTGYLWSLIKDELDKKAAANSLAAVATSGSAADVALTDTGEYYTSTNVEGALQEIGASLQTAGAVTVTESAGANSVLKVYTLTQGGQTIGTINIPKDLVATSGAIVNADASGKAGTYLKLTIANGSPIYIDVASLIEYNGVSDSSEIAFTDTNHKISGSLKTGSIAKTKLSSDVQASLGLADSAVQGSDIVEGTTNGAISVKGTAVHVHGLGTAAYTNSTAYDVAGAAQEVYDAIVALTNTEINTAIANASN